MLSIIFNRIMIEFLSKEKTMTHSGLLEIKFLFGNFFLISNNIVAIFYGFVLRVQSVKGEDISREKRHFVNIYTGMQWVKNCLVIILLPQVEKIFADIIFKLLIMKICTR